MWRRRFQRKTQLVRVQVLRDDAEIDAWMDALKGDEGDSHKLRDLNPEGMQYGVPDPSERDGGSVGSGDGGGIGESDYAELC